MSSGHWIWVMEIESVFYVAVSVERVMVAVSVYIMILNKKYSVYFKVINFRSALSALGRY